jgi:hypothetical protein
MSAPHPGDLVETGEDHADDRQHRHDHQYGGHRAGDDQRATGWALFAHLRPSKCLASRLA